MQQNATARIIDATIRAVRQEGLENLTTRRIAQLAETSPGNIYTFFSGKEELLEQCFTLIDREIAELFGRSVSMSTLLQNDPQAALSKIWHLYFDYLLLNPDKTAFYYLFRMSVGFPNFQKKRDESFFDPFVRIIEQLDRRYGVFSQIDPDILWSYVVNTTLMYAKYIIDGMLPNTPESVENIYKLLLGGLKQFILP